MVDFKIGYPNDHYFFKKRKTSEVIRSQYPGKFILSYHDNVWTKDAGYTISREIQTYDMFVELLEENEALILLLKPKKASYLEEIFIKQPLLQTYIDQKKIILFISEDPLVRLAPATIGMASDLVVGQGISTAAMECFFAGTLAFHIDFNQLDNRFGVLGRNRVVFNDLNSLKKAIQQEINRIDSNRITEEIKTIYQTLDPFQDGQAYKRTGKIIKTLQEACDRGYNRTEAIQEVCEKYKEYLYLNNDEK